MGEIALAILGAGMAGSAAYLHTHGDTDNGWLWFGVFLVFIVLI
jgi:hypothetical protein